MFSRAMEDEGDYHPGSNTTRREARPTIYATVRFPTSTGWYTRRVRVHLNADGSIEPGDYLGGRYPLRPTDTVEDEWRLFDCPGGKCDGCQDICRRHHRAMLTETDWHRLQNRTEEDANGRL